MTTNEIDKLSIDDLVQALEKKIIAVYRMRDGRQKIKLNSFPSKYGDISPVQQLLYKTVCDGVAHLKNKRVEQDRLAERFKSIPKRFPAPVGSDLDRKIYSHIIMGYSVMPEGTAGSRLKEKINKIRAKNNSFNDSYIEYMIEQAKKPKAHLGGDNFHILCRLGYPQATNEWMFVKLLSPYLQTPKLRQVMVESKELLAAYGCTVYIKR